jgi:hypothetical protein
MNMRTERGLIRLLAGDGRPLLAVVALTLLASGGFAIFIATRGEFLPHDVTFLGMAPQQLCAMHECRIVHFMIHDRVAFGGALIAIGVVYLWLVAGPLGARELWAWELFVASGAVGFLSFLAYLGYGYLDTWHGVATLAIFPPFIFGLILTRMDIVSSPGTCWFSRPTWLTTLKHSDATGRLLLFASAMGMLGGGLTILAVGMTSVFVPQDEAFLGIGRADLDAINPRLIPLIAHDRAGFGGAVCCCGLLLAGVAWRANFDVAARQALAVAGASGFGTAIFIHPAIGYTNLFHLAPAIAGAILFAAGLGLVSKSRRSSLE